MTTIERPAAGLRISATAGMLGGTIFGYSSGIIAGAQLQVQQDFGTGALGISLVTTALLVGALVGAVAADPIQHRVGPRRELAVAGVITAIGSVLSAIVPTSSLAMLIASRLLVGVGVGVISVLSPMYLSEIAPSRRRGAMVSSYQFLLSVGILVSYLVGAALAGLGAGWRGMFALGAVPSIALVLVVARSLDTPAYLVAAGRIDDARDLVAQLEPGTDAGTTVAALQATAHGPRAPWSQVFSRQERRVLTIALVLAVGQIITGINAVMYYAPQIFKSAGFDSDSDALLATVAIGAVNALATVIAIRYADRFGRRLLLLVGLTGMAVGAAGVGATSMLGGSALVGAITLLSVLVFVIAFAMSMGPLVWVLIGEVFPASIRSKGVSLSMAANWATNILVSLTFLTLMSALGTGASFALFALLSVLVLVFVVLRLPDTKGKTLAQIEAELHS